MGLPAADPEQLMLNVRRWFHVHRAAAVQSITTTPGNVWHQETCRCGMVRQYMTHRWGKSGPTQWVTVERLKARRVA